MYLVVKCYAGSRIVVGQASTQVKAMTMAERWVMQVGPQWIIQVIKQ